MINSIPGSFSSSFKKRVVSGLVLAPLAIFIIIYGGWLFAAMISAAAIISFYEWYGLCKLDKKRFVPNLIFGFIYLFICIFSYAYLRYVPEQGAWLALSVILCVWASDTGAYFMGKKFGGPKMAPTISPNKTFSGLAGAMTFCGLSLVLLVLVSPLFAGYMNTDIGVTTGHLWIVFLTGCVLGFIGQAGDLFISMMKRRVNMKDTGQLIPGHGGLLDRIDALLLVSPAFLSFVMLWLE